MGAEGEPLVDHLALLQAVQQAAHEHWRDKSEVDVTRRKKKKTTVAAVKLLGALTDVALFALFGFVAQADFKPVDFT